jgi:hypothetical protein
MTPASPLASVLGLLILAGCSSSQIEDIGATSTPSAPAQVPSVDMAGRWLLVAPGRGQCAMIFAGFPGAREGTIAPEGGCPGEFFTSRKWEFAQANRPAGATAALVIRNHNGEPLAELAFADTSRFDGKAASGEPVTLSR